MARYATGAVHLREHRNGSGKLAAAKRATSHTTSGVPIWTAARQLEPAGSGQLATVENKPAAPVVDPYDQGREEREEQAKAHHDAITDALQPTSSSSGLLHSFTAAGSNPSRARYFGSCSLHRQVSDTGSIGGVQSQW